MDDRKRKYKLVSALASVPGTTSLCAFFASAAGCRSGASCKFSHDASTATAVADDRDGKRIKTSSDRSLKPSSLPVIKREVPAPKKRNDDDEGDDENDEADDHADDNKADLEAQLVQKLQQQLQEQQQKIDKLLRHQEHDSTQGQTPAVSKDKDKKKKSFWSEKSGVYIKGLPFLATIGEIENMLGDCGERKGPIKQVLDEATGRWTGSVVCMFVDKASVELALALNGTVWSGSGGDGERYVKIVKFDAGAKKKKFKLSECCVFVGGLGGKSEAEVRAIFEPFDECGTLIHVRFPKAGEARGFCHLDFDSVEGRDAALKLNGKLPGEVYVRVPTAPVVAAGKKDAKKKKKVGSTHKGNKGKRDARFRAKKEKV